MGRTFVPVLLYNGAVLSGKRLAVSAKNRKYETPQILSDLPVETQAGAHFNFREFAITLARLIADKNTATPLVIGVSGAWGSGKTTLLKILREMLDTTEVLADPSKPALLDFVNAEESPQNQFRVCKTVWFNAWKYADEDELLVALVRVIVQTMADDSVVSKVIGKLLDPSYPRRDVVNTVLSWFSIKVGEASIGLNTGKAQPTPFAEKTALLDLFDEAFDRLAAAWVHRKLDVDRIDPAKGVLAIFVDDLDRCLPEKTVQVLEAVKLFLDKKGCVFILGADAKVVREAVAQYYRDAGVTGENADDYLKKIIQLRFDLPLIAQMQMDGFVQEQITKQSPLYRHWQAIVAGAEANPRKVKTSLNDLSLRWAIWQNTGEAVGLDFGLYVCWEVLMGASTKFRERLYKIRPENVADFEQVMRLLNDAFLWAEGDEDAAASFKDDVNEQMRRVLREIKPYKAGLIPEVIDRLLHLSAPPKAEAVPKVEKAPAEAAEKLLPEVEEIAVKAAREQVLRPKAVRGEAAPAFAGVQAFGSIEFVKVPKGRFIMGSKDDNKYADSDEKPQHTLDIPYDFYIARFPMTNQQYAEFIGEKFEMPKGMEEHPVVNVSWNEAQKYVAWLNKRFAGELSENYRFRLPTEAEWEKAARGEYGNEWPWGNEFDKNKCNSDEGGKRGTTPVGAYSPAGDSPYGCADMAGNVWEWCHSLYEPYPYKADDGREDEKASGRRLLRGGSFNLNRQYARCAFRRRNSPDYACIYNGFRVAASPVSPVK